MNSRRETTVGTTLLPSEEDDAALLNILEDFHDESVGLQETEKAILNLLEDAAAKESELESAHMAAMNILEDVAVSRNELESGHKVLLNILEDVDAERISVARMNRALTDEIAERKQAEEAQRRASVHMQSLLAASLDPMITIDQNGRIIDANPITERVTGITRAELAGTDIAGYFTDPEAVRNSYRRTLREGFVRDIELNIRNADGHTTPVLYNASVYRDEAGAIAGIFAAARDVSALKHAEDELRIYNERLAQTLDEMRIMQQQLIQSEKLSAIGTMAAGIAHELNNPMMGVINYLQNARRAAREPEVTQRLDKADRELQRMRRILRSLLAFARPVTEDVKRVDVADIFDRAAELLAPDFKTRDIRLVREVHESVRKAAAKEAHLQQVFVNLLLNARDALAHAEEKTVRFLLRERDGWIEAEITDSGPGIPREIQGKIFDPFFTTKPPGTGTGLGLSIARNIVQDVGGRLTVESAPGQGTRFTVALPVFADEAKPN